MGMMFNPTCQKVMEIKHAGLVFKATKGDKKALSEVSESEMEGLKTGAHDFAHFLEDNKAILAVYEAPKVRGL